jgi:hypothetical protein
LSARSVISSEAYGNLHPMEPVELQGELVAIEPLRAEHAAGLLAAADAEDDAGA